MLIDAVVVDDDINNVDRWCMLVNVVDTDADDKWY